MTCVMIYHKKYCELHGILDRHFNDLLNDEELSTIILVNFRTFRRLSWALMFSVFVVVSLVAVAPVISLIHQHFSTVYPMTYPLVYPTAYPWSLNRPGLRYKIHLIIELFATLPQFSVTSCIDSLFMLYGFQMTSRFRLMAHRLKTIQKMTDERKVIRECVMQHQSILRSRDLLSTIFGPIVLWLMTANAISLCTVIFQLSQMKTMTPSTIVHFMAYVIVKIIQTFMYAYTGTFLTAESENYQQAIYDCNWHANKRLMTSVVIMLSQKPILMTACNFSVVSLDIFVKVLNTAISYFFLLQTLS
uniref:Olfactory receptor 11 n=1 Tax=Meteorus pulchricornis TaxID=51522 RepID=A0A1S5VFK1_9HYME|nr:olfactory receptor 11 [Meteorus pulchricornis]